MGVFGRAVKGAVIAVLSVVALILYALLLNFVAEIFGPIAFVLTLIVTIGAIIGVILLDN